MASEQRILLIDDDDLLCQTLAEQLTAQDDVAVVDRAATGRDGVAMAERGGYDGILLDLGLPDMDGRDVCRVLRRNGLQCPILMLTAADSDDDAITGLEAGANDYVTKPFRLAVMLARLRTHIRRHEASDDARFTIGPYAFVPAAKRLTHVETGRKIRLTEKEAAILKYLYRQDKSVDRDTLLHEIWGYSASVTTHTLETHIYRLRLKIEPRPGETSILVTDAGGYRLCR